MSEMSDVEAAERNRLRIAEFRSNLENNTAPNSDNFLVELFMENRVSIQMFCYRVIEAGLDLSSKEIKAILAKNGFAVTPIEFLKKKKKAKTTEKDATVSESETAENAEPASESGDQEDKQPTPESTDEDEDETEAASAEADPPVSSESQFVNAMFDSQAPSAPITTEATPRLPPDPQGPNRRHRQPQAKHPVRQPTSRQRPPPYQPIPVVQKVINDWKAKHGKMRSYTDRNGNPSPEVVELILALRKANLMTRAIKIRLSECSIHVTENTINQVLAKRKSIAASKPPASTPTRKSARIALSSNPREKRADSKNEDVASPIVTLPDDAVDGKVSDPPAKDTAAPPNLPQHQAPPMASFWPGYYWPPPSYWSMPPALPFPYPAYPYPPPGMPAGYPPPYYGPNPMNPYPTGYGPPPPGAPGYPQMQPQGYAPDQKSVPS